MSVPTALLSEVCRIVQGGRLKLTGNDFVPKGYPAYGAGGLNGFLPSFEFDEPAVILSSIGARCGKCFYADGKWHSLANTQLIFPDESRVDGKFLWYQLNDESRWPRSGTGQPFIKPSDVKAHVVFLPPLEEQRRIAATLGKLDDLRAKRRAALDLRGALVEAVYLEMFGDPVANPKGLRRQPLGELVKLKSGEFLPAAAMADGGIYPVFGGNGISGYHDSYSFEESKIIVGRVGAYCGCVHVSPARSWITDNALYVSERHPDVTFDYLVYALTYARLNRYASQSGQPLISGSRIYPVQVLVPPRSEQEKFSRRVRSIGDLGNGMEASKHLLDSLFSSVHRSLIPEAR
jgi:type I restriction enzyme S subunit